MVLQWHGEKCALLFTSFWFPKVLGAAHSAGFLETTDRLVKMNSWKTEIISRTSVHGVRPHVTPMQSSAWDLYYRRRLPLLKSRTGGQIYETVFALF